MNPAKNYWKNWTNPIITRELCRALPKVDLNCHFDRTVTAEFLYKELLQDPQAMQHTKDLLPFDSKEDFLSQVRQASKHDSIWWKIIHQTIKTKDQIERVINELYKKAISHNIRCIHYFFLSFQYYSLLFFFHSYFLDLELLINPKNYSHANGLETEEVLQVVLNHTKEMNIKYKDQTYMGVIIISSFPNTIIDTYNMAKLAVKYSGQGSF
jgi:hypothetical protein